MQRYWAGKRIPYTAVNKRISEEAPQQHAQTPLPALEPAVATPSAAGA
jgi:hypothetical protein